MNMNAHDAYKLIDEMALGQQLLGFGMLKSG
jgi:hypothetical protein